MRDKESYAMKSKMHKELLLIAMIITGNLFLGYLFQISHDTPCFTELGFLGLGGIIFWGMLYQPIQKITIRLVEKKGVSNDFLIPLAGIGMVTSLINLFFCQFFIIGTFGLLFNCMSPSFQTLNASMTNNVAGNFVCFLLISGLAIHRHSKQIKPQIPEGNLSELNSPPFLLLTHQKTKKKVFLDEISYVQVVNNCIIIHTQTRHYIKYQSLKAFTVEVNYPSFKRVHRSTLVNLNFVKSAEINPNGDGKLWLSDGNEIRFSRSYKKGFWPDLQFVNS